VVYNVLWCVVWWKQWCLCESHTVYEHECLCTHTTTDGSMSGDAPSGQPIQAHQGPVGIRRPESAPLTRNQHSTRQQDIDTRTDAQQRPSTHMHSAKGMPRPVSAVHVISTAGKRIKASLFTRKHKPAVPFQGSSLLRAQRKRLDLLKKTKNMH
jgi:hypothetical protein